MTVTLSGEGIENRNRIISHVKMTLVAQERSKRTCNESNPVMIQTSKDQPPREGEPTHSEDGVDLTLIRWMLSLTPAERLEVLENNVRSILSLRGEAEA
jgi:hypothetical protein